jgi:hypothetical protein
MKPSGGFTPAGYRNFIRMHRDMVREALHTGVYNRLVKAGKMSVARVREILDSAKLSENRPIQKDKFNLNNKDPNDWLVLAEYGGFTVYDKKLKDIYQDNLDQFGKRFIIGHVLARIIERPGSDDAGLLVCFGGETNKVKQFLLACAASYCAAEHVSLWLDADDLALLDDSKYTIAPEPDRITGYRRTKVAIKQPLNLTLIATPDKVFRKSFDRYDEFKNTILELAEAKYRA